MSDDDKIADQPPPIVNDRPAVWDLVIADMRERDAVGRERYGTPLQPHNGRDALVDAYQELLDGAVYLRQRIEEDRELRAEVAKRDAEIGRLTAELARLTIALVGRPAGDSDHSLATITRRDLCEICDEVIAQHAEIARLTAKPSEAASDMSIRCQFHAGAEVPACGCPPLDSPGAHDYRALLATARAEIARLTAELAAARAVPADVEAAIETAIDHFWFSALEIDDPKASEGTDGFPGWPDAGHSNVATLRAAIVRAIAEAQAGAVAHFIDGHAKRLCEQAGEHWTGDGEQLDAWAAKVHDVLNHLHADENGAVHDGRKVAAPPETVGGLLATAPVDLGKPPGSQWTHAIEWLDGGAWFRLAPGTSADGSLTLVLSTWGAAAWNYDDENPIAIDACVYALPARLVPAHLADLDPSTRDPLPTTPPRCSCTHEAGDSRCLAHPTCSECGAPTPRLVDECNAHRSEP